jgi:hypothetical protein
MNTYFKPIVLICLVCIVSIHFFLITIYCAPFKITNPKLNFISQLYVYPLFHQTWSLFVPAPVSKRQLFVRYKTKNEFGVWKDVLNDEVMRHKQKVVLGKEAVILLLSNAMVYELIYLNKQNSVVFKIPPSHSEFKVLNFEINNYLKNHLQVLPSTNYEILLVSNSCQLNGAYYFKSLKVN